MAAIQIAEPVDLVEQLLRAAFDTPRDPRSPEYKEGVRAYLQYRIKNMGLHSPYPKGTAQADAFYAGVAEGQAIWRCHVEEALRKQPVSADGA